MADLQQNIIDADELVTCISQLCSLAHLEPDGSLAARKERLSTFLAGSKRRQRAGWLQFFMHVVDANAVGSGPNFAIDYDKLSKLTLADQDLLADYIEIYHLGGAFLRAPPQMSWLICRSAQMRTMKLNATLISQCLPARAF